MRWYQLCNSCRFQYFPKHYLQPKQWCDSDDRSCKPICRHVPRGFSYYTWFVPGNWGILPLPASSCFRRGNNCYVRNSCCCRCKYYCFDGTVGTTRNFDNCGLLGNRTWTCFCAGSPEPNSKGHSANIWISNHFRWFVCIDFEFGPTSKSVVNFIFVLHRGSESSCPTSRVFPQ